MVWRLQKRYLRRAWQAKTIRPLASRETVAVPDGIEAPVCRDPLDRPFPELAVAGKADWLVTGDNDLLVLAPDSSVPIVTPATLRETLGASMTNDPPS